MNNSVLNRNIFPVNCVNIKKESMIKDSDVNSFTLLGLKPEHVPHFTKNVEIVCWKKVYRGCGIRNMSGGLEFFSEDTLKSFVQKNTEKLGELKRQKQCFLHELQSLHDELSSRSYNPSILNTKLRKLQSLHEKYSDELISLVIKARQGLISDSEKISRRKMLRMQESKINKDISEINQKLIDLPKKQQRIKLLKCYITQLDFEIQECEKNKNIYSTITIGIPEILSFEFKKGFKSESCCLFVDVFDYISYLNLLHEDAGKNIPCHCDCYVLNDPRNFVSLLLQSDDYDKIYLFFPNTVYGSTLEQTISQRNPYRVVDASFYYKNYVSIYDYIKNRNTQNQ